MKFLIRGKINFLEVELKDNKLNPTNQEVDPKTLIHFGTDLIGSTSYPFILDRDYLRQIEAQGVDYLFISQECVGVDSGQCGKTLRVLTAYKKI